MNIAKKIIDILGAIVFAFLILIGILLFAVGISGEKIVSMYIVGIVLFVAGLIGEISIGKKNAKTRDKMEDNTKNNDKVENDFSPKLTYREKVLRNKERMYRRMKYKLTFVAGLPLMQGAVCKVVSTNDKIIINGQGTTFELNKEKITSITIEKNITKHTQAVSSAGGALAGAMAFGVVGAAIGGRAKAKNFNALNRYIVITYFDSEENVKYIIFDYKNKGTYLVEEFKTFNKSNVKQKTVEID